MVAEPERKTPKEQKYTPRATGATENGENRENNLFSPRFRSVAAMAGWDEETLLIASLIVDDTPDREFKTRKRSDLIFKTPPSNSRRKRRDHKKTPGPASISAITLNLDEEETTKKEGNERSKTLSQISSKNDKIKSEKEKSSKDSADSESSNLLPCMDKLREELSCAICLDICYEPSTTPCGHSFCKKCLRSAADKCGKRCPKCRQIICNGRSCTINTVLWNTIQLLFPNEVAARKASSTSESQDAESRRTSERDRYNDDNSRRSSLRSANRSLGSDVNLRRRRRGVPVQDEDAALALRLQREEFMQVIRGREDGGGRISVSLARANLRAMASRAMNIRIRSRHS